MAPGPHQGGQVEVRNGEGARLRRLAFGDYVDGWKAGRAAHAWAADWSRHRQQGAGGITMGGGIRMAWWSVHRIEDVVGQLAAGALVLADREGPGWPEARTAILLEDVLRGEPIGACKAGRSEVTEAWTVEDGVQRLEALRQAWEGVGEGRAWCAELATGRVELREIEALPADGAWLPIHWSRDTGRFLEAEERRTAHSRGQGGAGQLERLHRAAEGIAATWRGYEIPIAKIERSR